MLNSKPSLKLQSLFILPVFLVLFLASSCMPTETSPAISTNNSTGDSPTNPDFSEPNYPLSTTFIQEGAVQSASGVVLPVNFGDSFLIRGKTLSQYLRTIPTSTKFCLVGKYNYVSGKEKFLVLAAKAKSFTDLPNKTTEYYLQVEPANDTANQNDCLTYNLTNTLYANASNPSLHFSLTQLCTDCSTSVTSTGLKLYFINGEEVPTLSFSALTLTLSGNGTNSGSACSENSLCRARGYDCCLQSQCVTDGAVKPGATSDPGFTAAQEDVRLNPARFVVYPQYYFVCESRPDNDGGDGDTTDPDYEASVRLMELKLLYDCLNKAKGEFSYCTLKFSSASTSIPGTFSAATSNYYDDVNFSSLNPNLAAGDYVNNIVKITYAGQTLYEENITPPTDASFISNTENDDITSAQEVRITAPLPSNARDANLYITYKVDGTCEKVGSTIAKCTKTYVQASSDPTSTTYHDSSKIFLLPSYADASPSASIIVKVGGTVVPEDSATWSKAQSPNRIVFANSYNLYQNQTVEITYFVTSGAANLLKMRTAAQNTVNSMCTCAAGSKCNLKPILDSNGGIANYECTYPTSSGNEPPANQTVYVSNKNVPHRYYDKFGVNYDENYSTAPDQELSPFSYTNNDILKPNNVSGYVGFNEIYGSFAKSGVYVAKPAKLVSVKKDKSYDIIVNSGVFSSCSTCGSDYYTSLKKIFPQNFSGQGGGYSPDNYDSKRENSTGLYRADDLLFGRACFVPATMIPWTHMSATSTTVQRQNRLAAQHFLFANGYNRDWYGFDYGSLIGSFDGVTWFSIGNQRRIKATTSKLYLAVNAYLGDLNVDNNFNVTVSETSSYSSDIADHDTETDGAQCQRSHFCSNDNDCFRQLGYDYTCQSVSGLTTNWPIFDANATETVGSTVKSLISIVGGTNGQAKRCVYRGRGTPCLANLDLAATNSNYNGSTSVGHLTCSPNNYCASLSGSPRFNDGIARFANTPVAQNTAGAAATLSDTVGLGARIILRPFDYYGTDAVPTSAQSALSVNKIDSICIPGKDVSNAADNFALNSRAPTSRTDSSDKILGVGTTSPLSMTSRSLNACPATDASGNSLQLYDVALGSTTLSLYTINQNLSSNLLDLTPLKNLGIYSSTSGSPISTVGYQKNTCLRAPGASCFSDMECAPSTFIATKAKAAGLSSLLNPAEAKFWEEELVCGNPDFKILNAGAKNPNFDVKKNFCCREYGKTLNVYTQTDTSTYQWCDGSKNVRVAGVNMPINSSNRYSRVHTVYDKMTCDTNQISSTKSFALSVAAPSSTERMRQILGQYKTLDALNQRTCCTKNWVRSFASENGGGHAFSRSKLQSVDKEMFKHVSWSADDESSITPAVNDNPFECDPDQYSNVSCEIKNLTPSEEDKYLTWAGSLELIGIPQVAIKTNDEIYKLVDDNQNAYGGDRRPLTDSLDRQIFLSVNVAGEDFRDSSSTRYYSAASYTKLNMGNNDLKKVFSENEFNCCVPSGQEVPDTVTSSQCCTGQVATSNNIRRCCLPDFTDVTVYLNRYVSSEGSGLSDSAYDPATGYIKDAGVVKNIIAQKNLCCSGKAMTGVAISRLPIPLTDGTYKPFSSNTSTRRFNYRTDEVDNNPESGSVGTIFDKGVRWNNHVYCVPDGFGE
jgi:hypothetical protein